MRELYFSHPEISIDKKPKPFTAIEMAQKNTQFCCGSTLVNVVLEYQNCKCFAQNYVQQRKLKKRFSRSI